MIEGKVTNAIIIFAIATGTFVLINRESLIYDTMSRQTRSSVKTLSSRSRPRIAFISSYIESSMWPKERREKMVNGILDHITNKVCYSNLWNYDFIFNQTREITFDDDLYENCTLSKQEIEYKKKYWLKFGGWERVSHIQAALPNYEWILYGDLDYIIKDFSRPIESFLQELELYGKKNVHVIVPSDKNDGTKPDAFSAFAIMIRNSPFGKKLVKNWKSFAMGICPGGNWPSTHQDESYEWFHGDQTGLWYALMKTHMDFFPNDVYHSNSIVQCNKTTGLIDGDHRLGFKEYFTANGYELGNYGEFLKNVPDNQTIIFSRSSNDSMSGLGVDHNWVYREEEKGKPLWHSAYALHQHASSAEWTPTMKNELELCKKKHGCFAKMDTNGIKVGCDPSPIASDLLQP